MSEQRTAAGIALTEDLMNVCAPLIHERQTDLVIEAMAATFIALLTAAQMDKHGARVVLQRYAERILEFAEEL